MYLPTVASRRGRPHPRGKIMTQTSGETSCQIRRPVPSQRRAAVDGLICHCGGSISRARRPRPTADGWCRSIALSAERYGRDSDGVAGACVAGGPRATIRQLALRATVVAPRRQSHSSQTNDFTGGNRPPEYQPMIHTPRRRSDRPSSVSRHPRIRMATDRSVRPRDRTESDSEHHAAAGRRQR